MKTKLDWDGQDFAREILSKMYDAQILNLDVYTSEGSIVHITEVGYRVGEFLAYVCIKGSDDEWHILHYSYESTTGKTVLTFVE